MEPLRRLKSAETLGQISRLMADFPFWGSHARIRRDICRQLRARTIRALDAWGTDPERYRVLCFVSSVVMEYGGWPNVFYLPDDPCELLFCDTSIELRISEATLLIQDGLALQEPIAPEWLSDTTYGELIDNLTRVSTRTDGVA
jgi:hypothetical protein